MHVVSVGHVLFFLWRHWLHIVYGRLIQRVGAEHRLLAMWRGYLHHVRGRHRLLGVYRWFHERRWLLYLHGVWCRLLRHDRWQHLVCDVSGWHVRAGDWRDHMFELLCWFVHGVEWRFVVHQLSRRYYVRVRRDHVRHMRWRLLLDGQRRGLLNLRGWFHVAGWQLHVRDVHGWFVQRSGRIVELHHVPDRLRRDDSRRHRLRCLHGRHLRRG